MNHVIRPARPRDLRAINDIYNHYVTRSTCTYQEVPTTAGERKRWFAHHGKAHPVIVAERDGVVIGWASLSKWSDRPAYAQTAETSFYVSSAHRGSGIGRSLKEHLIATARALAGLLDAELDAVHVADDGARVARNVAD